MRLTYSICYTETIFHIESNQLLEYKVNFIAVLTSVDNRDAMTRAKNHFKLNQNYLKRQI